MMQQIKSFANHYAFTDVHPFEVVRVISDKTVEVRAMDSELDPDWKPEIIAGGFAGHCTNQQGQKWNYTQREDAPTIRIRYSATKGRWQDKHGNRYIMSDAPRRYHDYNF